MGPHYTHKKGETVCVDYAREGHSRSSTGNQNGGLLYTTEAEKGSIDEGAYPHNREVGCAVCSAPVVTYTAKGGTRGFCKVTVPNQKPVDQSSDWALTGGNNVGAHSFNSLEYSYWALRAQNECLEQCPACNAYGVTSKAGYACFQVNECTSDGARDRQFFLISPAASTGVGTTSDNPTGSIYVQWGSRSCSTGSVKLYDNFMAGSKYDHRGSGYNALCMHPSPQWPPGASTANNNGNLLYGTEYEVQGAKKDMDAACAVCLAPNYVKTYVQWGCAPALWTAFERGCGQRGPYCRSFPSALTHATRLRVLRRQTCSNGHKTEYKGLIMAEHWNHRSKSEHVCVDYRLQTHSASAKTNHNGLLLYSARMHSGAADEAAYTRFGEVGCAVCSTTAGAPYPRYGHRQCPAGTRTLYSGFMASSHYSHKGSGANTLCMHPTPQKMAAVSTFPSHYAALYGMEYQNTGTADKSHDVDAACAMCERPGTVQTYVQWGCAPALWTAFERGCGQRGPCCRSFPSALTHAARPAPCPQASDVLQRPPHRVQGPDHGHELHTTAIGVCLRRLRSHGARTVQQQER
jgi:hypothetical protein